MLTGFFFTHVKDVIQFYIYVCLAFKMSTYLGNSVIRKIYE